MLLENIKAGQILRWNGTEPVEVVQINPIRISSCGFRREGNDPVQIRFLNDNLTIWINQNYLSV
jgi:hypothetical protein